MRYAPIVPPIAPAPQITMVISPSLLLIRNGFPQPRHPTGLASRHRNADTSRPYCHHPNTHGLLVDSARAFCHCPPLVSEYLATQHLPAVSKGNFPSTKHENRLCQFPVLFAMF